MAVAKDGSFSFIIGSEDITKGLRSTKGNPRNSPFLIQSTGVVPRDGILKTLEDLNSLRIDTSIITDGFPYPQLFVFPALAVVCGETKIYEVNLATGALTLKITVDAGITWSAVDFSEYVYMSNGKVAVVRDPFDKDWAISDLPIASAICNFNGQVLIGAPDVERA